MRTAFLVACLVTLVIWLITHILWIRLLGAANGSRPFIALTVIVAWVMTTLSVLMVISSVANPPDNLLEYLISYAYVLCALLVCGAMWHLHSEIDKIFKRLPHE